MSSRALTFLTAALAAASLPLLAGSMTDAEEVLPWASGADSSAGYAPQTGYTDSAPRTGYSQAPGYDPYAPGTPQPRYGTASPANSSGGYAANDSHRPQGAYDDSYRPQGGYDDSYRSQGSSSRSRDGFTDPGQPVTGGTQDYGQPYSPPPAGDNAYAEPPRDSGSTFDQGEIISAGHSFFGAVSQNLASAVEYAFKSQGRPNGYILGEDAGGAFILGLRYGEGMLYTKDAGDHKVYWQGPSLGYDAGAEGSKTMVLVYNLRDPAEIYNRFGGVEGTAYLVGGVSVEFQKYGDVTLGVIRSGVGLRLGANVGYSKYTREPTWNPL